jgi:hypothetical protein
MKSRAHRAIKPLNEKAFPGHVTINIRKEQLGLLRKFADENFRSVSAEIAYRLEWTLRITPEEAAEIMKRGVRRDPETGKRL